MDLHFEQLVQKGQYGFGNQNGHHRCAAYDDRCFHQELQRQLFAVAAKYFSDSDFFGAIDCLCGRQIDEIHAGDHNQEDAYEHKCSNQGMTERMSVVISKAVVITNFAEGLKYIAVCWILCMVMSFREGREILIERLGLDAVRQNDKCI